MRRLPWIVGIIVGFASFGLGTISYTLPDSLIGGVALGVTAGVFTWFIRKFSAPKKDRHTIVEYNPPTFRNLDTKPSDTIGETDLTGLVDAYTLELLDTALNIHQCVTCQVYYHGSTVRFLETHNDGQCISCLSREIRPLSEIRVRKHGRNYDAEIVTLANYKKFSGRVVIFQGRVTGIERDRQGKNYAVIFQGITDSTAPVQMFILEPNVKDVGGTRFIENLLDKTITVRGLLKQHGGLLYAIFVTSRSMILEIK